LTNGVVEEGEAEGKAERGRERQGGWLVGRTQQQQQQQQQPRGQPSMGTKSRRMGVGLRGKVEVGAWMWMRMD
jgi:hypothetical protein